MLVAIVVTSFRQSILAYPKGGGAYVVTRENLGRYPSLVAGAALLIDYVLTVAVSIAAGIDAITSAIPPLWPYRVTLCVAGVVAIAVVNLRGVREAGRLFAGADLHVRRGLPGDDRVGARPVARRATWGRRRRPPGRGRAAPRR